MKKTQNSKRKKTIKNTRKKQKRIKRKKTVKEKNTREKRKKRKKQKQHYIVIVFILFQCYIPCHIVILTWSYLTTPVLFFWQFPIWKAGWTKNFISNPNTRFFSFNIKLGHLEQLIILRNLVASIFLRCLPLRINSMWDCFPDMCSYQFIFLLSFRFSSIKTTLLLWMAVDTISNCQVTWKGCPVAISRVTWQFQWCPAAIFRVTWQFQRCPVAISKVNWRFLNSR